MTDLEFTLFKKHQFCDNPICPCYGVVGGINIRIKTRKNRQLYCNRCASASFSVRRGTMFYGLRTLMDKIVSVLGLYTQALTDTYCTYQTVPYSGRGRPCNPIQNRQNIYNII